MFVVFVMIAACVPLLAQLPEDQKRAFDLAEKRIMRLPPAAFPGLPGNVVRELERRRCMIPQTAFANRRHNVISGHFTRAGETDWAVLCSANGTSTILVFWNGSEKNPAAIGSLEDRIFLQGITPEKVGFSRMISPVGRDFIIRHYDAYGGTKPPPINHQGINDEFVEKGSVVWYFRAGKWLKLTGSD